MRLDFTKLGASLLATGPILMNLMGSKYAWWTGFIFTLVGPFLMSLKVIERKKHNG